MNDINKMKVDAAFSACECMQEYAGEIENPYCFQCGDARVNIRFADDGSALDTHLLSFFGGLKKI